MAKSTLFNETKRTGGLADGFKSVLNAFDVFKKHKGFGKFFIIPFLLNIVILGTIYYFAVTNIVEFVKTFNIADILKNEDAWYNVVVLKSILNFLLKMAETLVILLAVLVMTYLSILIYSVIGSIITSPFNDFISEKIEVVEGGETFDEPFSASVIGKDILRSIGNVFRMLRFYILVSILLLLLNFIPYIGSVAYSVLSFFVTAYFLGFSFYDFPLERRRYTFKEKRKITGRYKWLVIGTGAAFFLISLIPIVGFLGLNLAAVGATREFTEHIKPALLERSTEIEESGA
ncbi:MAG: hypothetical protein GY754_38395 [bacterium]|nr:hypothetical protein [bacterium]